MTRTHKYKKYYKGGRRTQKNRRRSALLKKRKSLKGGDLSDIATGAFKQAATTVAKHAAGKAVQHVMGSDYAKTALNAGLGSVINTGLTKSIGSAIGSSMGNSSELLSEMRQLESRIDKQGKQTQRQLDKTLSELKKTKEDAMYDRIEEDPKYRKILEEKKAKAGKTQKEIEYEVGRQERTILGGLVEFPTPKGGKDTAFFKLINVTEPSRFAGMLNNKNVSLSYVTIRGALKKQLLKKVLNPDNYYFKVAFDHQAPSELKGKKIVVSSRNAIINPKRAKELQEFLMPKNRGGKSYYIVVGHAADDPKGNGVLVYRLPHMGFIDCDGKKLILMTKSSKTMEYDINDNPTYRYIGLMESKGHSDLYTMMDSLKTLHDKNEASAFEDLRVEYLKELSDPSSQIQKIVKFHLQHTLKKGNKEKKKMMKYLYSLVHLNTCPSFDEAYDKLDPGKSAVFDDKKLSEMVRLLDEAVEKTKGRANSIKDKSNLEDIIISRIHPPTRAVSASDKVTPESTSGGGGGAGQAGGVQLLLSGDTDVNPPSMNQNKAILSESIHYGDEYSIDIIKEIYKKLIKKKPAKDEVGKQQQQLEDASKYLVEQLTKKLKDLSHKDDKFGTKVKQNERQHNNKLHGNITDRELEEQKASNDAAGHDKHSDAELKTQRAKNKEAGRGHITDKEVENEREENKGEMLKGETLAPTNEQLRNQRERNEKAGLGHITHKEVENEREKNEEERLKDETFAPTNEQLRNQRERNEKAGLGHITHKEVENERIANEKEQLKGEESPTNEQLRNQRERNEKAGLGHITHKEVENEREKNEEERLKDEKFAPTNEQLKTQRAENKEAGRGHITHKKVATERETNERNNLGYYTNEELRRQRSENIKAGHGPIVDAQREANASKAFDKAMSRVATSIADGVANSNTIPANAAVANTAEDGAAVANTAEDGAAVANTAEDGAAVANTAEDGAAVANTAEDGAAVANTAEDGAAVANTAEDGAAVVNRGGGEIDGGAEDEDQVSSEMTEEDKVVDYFKDFIPYIHSGRVSKKPEIRKLIFELIYIVNALYRVGVRIELINKFTTAKVTEKKKIIKEMSVSTGVYSRMKSALNSLTAGEGITTELTDADLKIP